MFLSIENMARQIQRELRFPQFLSEEKALALASELDRLDGKQDGIVDLSDPAQVSQAVQNVLGGTGYSDSYLREVVHAASVGLVVVPFAIDAPELISWVTGGLTLTEGIVFGLLPLIGLTPLSQNPEMNIVDRESLEGFYRGRGMTFEMNEVPFPEAIARSAAATPKAKASPARQPSAGKTSAPQDPENLRKKLVQLVRRTLKRPQKSDIRRKNEKRLAALTRPGPMPAAELIKLERGLQMSSLAVEREAKQRTERESVRDRQVAEYQGTLKAETANLRIRLDAVRYRVDESAHLSASKQLAAVRSRVIGDSAYAKPLEDLKRSIQDVRAKVEVLEESVRQDTEATALHAGQRGRSGFGYATSHTQGTVWNRRH